MSQKSKMRHAVGALSTVIAPLANFLARATGQQSMLNVAERLDDLNFRPVLKKMPPKHATLRLLAAARLASAASAEDSHLVIKYLPYSKAQILQDLFAVLACKGKTAGRFVEVGAGNGYTSQILTHGLYIPLAPTGSVPANLCMQNIPRIRPVTATARALPHRPHYPLLDCGT